MMSNTDLPANVHVLRPRKVSLSEKLDLFLDEHGLDLKEAAKQPDPSRPKSINGNALVCASCGEAEYLTRDYCRCGHYLRGQLEDEYLAWENQVYDDHNKLADAIALKIKPLRYLFAIGLPFLVGPMLYLNFWADSFTLYPLLWMAPGILISGIVALTEKVLTRPLEASAHFLNTYSIETFIDQRFFQLKVIDQ
ncbi:MULTISPECIES: hypothetical protein [Marivita]|nr:MULTISPECIES: hypothetical protein [Marivita]MBM2320510.1 hypothetical protein [Marivita cryptomonadis]MBM2339677.1 hypothetical protein [Marivita cryptomonadis]MBM2349014.1 hypothetical protein [Marivita cryptomonadis]MBM2363529.1 hypothetical protein [Marivita cryptomonadis]MBM2406799.1 hypothetical protein [Marivita cryptomonadis]